MAEQLNVKMLQRYQPAADWVLQNPVLERGEIGIEEDTNKFKFGNGIQTWTDLSYASTQSFIFVDDTLNKNSTNPIQNRAVYEALQNYLPLSGGALELNAQIVFRKDNATLRISADGLVATSREPKMPILISSTASGASSRNWLGIKRANSLETLVIGDIDKPIASFADNQITFSQTPAVGNSEDKLALESAIPQYEDWINYDNLINTLGFTPAKNQLVTQSESGLMSYLDKIKLDNIEELGQEYELPVASTELGGVKTTSTVTNSVGYTSCPIINGVVYYSEQKIQPKPKPANGKLYILGTIEDTSSGNTKSTQIYSDSNIYVDATTKGRLYADTLAIQGRGLITANYLRLGWSDTYQTHYGIDDITKRYQEVVGDEIYERNCQYTLPSASGTLATKEDVGLEISRLKSEGEILSLSTGGVLYIPKLIFTNDGTSVSSPLSMNAEGFSITNGTNSIWASPGNIGVKWSPDGQWNLNGGGVKCTYLGKEEVALTGNELRFRIDANDKYTSFNERGINIPVLGPQGYTIDTKLSSTALQLSTGDSYALYSTTSILSPTGRELPLDQIALLGEIGSGKIKVALIGRNGTFEIKPNMTVLILPWSGSTFYKGDPNRGGTNLNLSNATTSFIISSGKTNADSSMNENGTYYRAAIIYATSVTVKSNQNLYETSTPLWFKNAHSGTSGTGNAYIFYTE